MRISELTALDREYITPTEAASVLDCAPQRLRDQAHRNPASLGFPVIIMGRKIRIPKEPFIAFMKGGCFNG